LTKAIAVFLPYCYGKRSALFEELTAQLDFIH